MSAPSGPAKNASFPIMQVEAAPIGPSQRNAKFTASRAKKVTKPVAESTLIGDINITFSGPEERLRANAGLLPGSVFRMSYEDSGTPNYHQATECQKKSRDAPSAKLDHGNGFQPFETFNASKHMNPERIKSTFNPQRRRPLSPYVATFQDRDSAVHMCHRHYNELRAVGQRPTVTEIDISTLIPGTMHGILQTFMVQYKGSTLVRLDSSEKKRQVKLDVWIRRTARPEDGSPISIQQLYDSGADMWIRGIEMRKTGPFDMNYGAADTHDNDWLCCGPVPRSCITKVMPFDGEKLHRKKTSQLVKSQESIEIYIFNWDIWRWLHNPDLTDYRPYRLERSGDKRFPSENDDGHDEGCSDEPRRKRT